MITLQTPLAEIKGIPPRFLKRFDKLKILTIKDLLWHFPSRYEDFSETLPIAQLEPGQQVTIQGVIRDIKLRRSFRRRFVIVEAIIADDSGEIKAVWFNQPYLLNTLHPGRAANFSGKVSAGEKEIYLSHPAYELLSTQMHADDTQINADVNEGTYQRESAYKSALISETRDTARLIPIYPETRGLTSRGIRFLVQPILKNIGEIPEWLPEEILEKAKLPEINRALNDVHFPESAETALLAKKRFAFEDIFLLQLFNMRQKLKLANEKAPIIETNLAELKKITEALPFKLTLSQKKSLWEIVQDIGRPAPMNRLLQGDVGSGKTVVAAIAALLAANNGFQSAFMAPTEILARQHFQTFKSLFPSFDKKIALITSGESRIFYGDGLEDNVKKTELIKKIEIDEIKIIFGTHSLIQKNVRFASLAFVVIDEQHRFGVRQRQALVSQTKTDLTQTNADNGDNDGFLYKELSYKIRGCLINVKDNIGSGHKEIIYQKAVAEELKNIGLSFEQEKSIDVKYNNKKIGIYRPDFIIEDKIILELKALSFTGAIEKKQLWTYLKGSIYKVAFLANFSGRGVEINRIVYETARESPRKSASSLRASASMPHFLSMSATPIPRTLTLTIFGDLDLSVINELPKNRKGIVTKIVDPLNRSLAYDFIRSQVKRGRQVFVICPRIEPSANSESVANLRISEWQKLEIKSVVEEYEKLSKKIFPDLRVSMLHGQMKPKEKADIMKKFSAQGGSASGGQTNKIDILVSTSVIEVGVDIPNATIMMIEGADRFGLAQLYQFRGRVGRGEHQSFCFLFTDSPAETTGKRLRAIVEAKNGFELAEKDLKLRGPGEFIGQKQTGLPDVAMRGLQDFELIKSSREAAMEILEKDKNFKNHPLLAEKLAEFEKRIHLE